MSTTFEEMLKADVTDNVTNDAFRVHAPLHFFEKAGAPEGQQRRIAGVVSTEGKDRDNEIILQRGLDFGEFLDFGWYNSNHSKDPDKVLGYPESVQYFAKGDKLPDGSIAPNNCHWAEGYLIQGYEPAEKIWNLGLALTKGQHKRRLAYSIEGAIVRRTGENNKTIAKAKVRNVAITHCPVNPETGLIALAKALDAAEHEEHKEEAGSEENAKALTSSSPSGRAIIPQSLEQKPKKRPAMLTKSEATKLLLSKRPHLSRATAERVVQLTAQFRELGLLGDTK